MAGIARRASPDSDELDLVVTRYRLSDQVLGAISILVAAVQNETRPNVVFPKWRTAAAEKAAGALLTLDLEEVRVARRMADLGSGAGFPGLVLAAALSAVDVTLVERDAQRCEFLRHTATAMGLSNVEIRNQLVKRGWFAGTGTYDLVTAQSVKLPAAMIGLATPMLAPGGALVLIFSSGRKAREDQAASLAAAQANGLRPGAVRTVALSESMKRYFQVYVKAQPRIAA